MTTINFTAFLCRDVGNLSYLDIDMGIECWAGEHMAYAYGIALPSIILWCLGIPALACIYISRLYRNNMLDDKFTFIVYGFFYNGYKRDYYFWEIIVLYRKAAIIVILVFFRRFNPLI
jgi:hypothetical protein